MATVRQYPLFNYDFVFEQSTFPENLVKKERKCTAAKTVLENDKPVAGNW